MVTAEEHNEKGILAYANTRSWWEQNSSRQWINKVITQVPTQELCSELV